MTNYEKIMSEMTPEVIVDIVENPCKYCNYRKVNCVEEAHESMCKDGVYIWLKKAVEQ